MRVLKFLGCASLLAASVVATSCSDSAKGGKMARAINYKTMNVTQGVSRVKSDYAASIRGEQFVDIRPQVSGEITKILIEEGAAVKRGQKLFIIDQVPYQAALDVAVANVKSAEAKVATAKLNAKSCRELLKEQIISENEQLIAENALAEAESALALAKAQEQNARNDLSYTVITSPVDGVASMIPYRVGALVSSSISDPLVSVSNNDNMYVYFSMSESQLLTLTRKMGSTEKVIESMSDLELVLNDGVSYTHRGAVDAVSGTINRTTGTVSVRAKFDNPEQMLRDGGSGRVVIETAYDSYIVIPKIATFELQNKIFVYRVVDGKAQSSQITVLPVNNGTEYIVTSGVKVGDVIIAEGAGLIREGAQITAPASGAKGSKGADGAKSGSGAKGADGAKGAEKK